MKRYQKRRTRLKYSALAWVLLLSLAGTPLVIRLVRSSLPSIVQFTQKAAMISALWNMPEGSLELLRDRFAPEAQLPGEPSSSSVPDLPSRTEPAPQDQSSSNSQPESASPSSSEEKETPVPPEVPQEYRGPMVEENLAGRDNIGLIKFGSGYLKNYTQLSSDQIYDYLSQPMELQITDTKEPQVLIVHTHATESYEPYDREYYDNRNTWRSTDNSENMVAVGDAVVQALEEAGIGVVHDDIQHDYPSYNGSYDRSAATIKQYLKKYPTIRVVLDVHRDAIERDNGLLVRPVVEIDGKKAAQLMIIAGCDDGSMNMPYWGSNLRFAAALQDQIEQDYPDLTRPIFFCYRKYNMDLTRGSLLLEFGAHANTLEESVYTGELVGKSLAKLLLDHVKENDEPAETKVGS